MRKIFDLPRVTDSYKINRVLSDISIFNITPIIEKDQHAYNIWKTVWSGLIDINIFKIYSNNELKIIRVGNPTTCRIEIYPWVRYKHTCFRIYKKGSPCDNLSVKDTKQAKILFGKFIYPFLSKEQILRLNSEMQKQLALRY